MCAIIMVKVENAHYDRVNLAIPKGQKEIIKAHADSHGESINAFIGRAIREAIERDNAASRADEGRTEDKERAGE